MLLEEKRMIAFLADIGGLGTRNTFDEGMRFMIYSGICFGILERRLFVSVDCLVWTPVAKRTARPGVSCYISLFAILELFHVPVCLFSQCARGSHYMQHLSLLIYTSNIILAMPSHPRKCRQTYGETVPTA